MMCLVDGLAGQLYTLRIRVGVKLCRALVIPNVQWFVSGRQPRRFVQMLLSDATESGLPWCSIPVEPIGPNSGNLACCVVVGDSETGGVNTVTLTRTSGDTGEVRLR